MKKGTENSGGVFKEIVFGILGTGILFILTMAIINLAVDHPWMVIGWLIVVSALSAAGLPVAYAIGKEILLKISARKKEARKKS